MSIAFEIRLPCGSNNGSIDFNSATTSINAALNSRGSMSSVGDFTFNNNSTLYGTIAAKGNVTFNNGANVVYIQL